MEYREMLLKRGLFASLMIPWGENLAKLK